MKILVGYNATDGRTEGLRLALKQAQAFNAEVILLASLMVDDEGHAFKSNAMDDAKIEGGISALEETTRQMVISG